MLISASWVANSWPLLCLLLALACPRLAEARTPVGALLPATGPRLGQGSVSGMQLVGKLWGCRLQHHSLLVGRHDSQTLSRLSILGAAWDSGPLAQRGRSKRSAKCLTTLAFARKASTCWHQTRAALSVCRQLHLLLDKIQRR